MCFTLSERCRSSKAVAQREATDRPLMGHSNQLVSYGRDNDTSLTGFIAGATVCCCGVSCT